MKNITAFNKKLFKELYWFDNQWLEVFARKEGNMDRLLTLNDFSGIPYNILTKMIPYNNFFLLNGKMTDDQWKYELNRLHPDRLLHMVACLRRIPKHLYPYFLNLVKDKCSAFVYIEALKGIAVETQSLSDEHGDEFFKYHKFYLWIGDNVKVSTNYIIKVESHLVGRYSLNTVTSIIKNPNCPAFIIDKYFHPSYIKNLHIAQAILGSSHCTEAMAKEIYQYHLKEDLASCLVSNSNLSLKFVEEACSINNSTSYMLQLCHINFTKKMLMERIEDEDSLNISHTELLLINPNFDIECLDLLLETVFFKTNINSLLIRVQNKIIQKHHIEQIINIINDDKRPYIFGLNNIFYEYLNDQNFIIESLAKLKRDTSSQNDFHDQILQDIFTQYEILDIPLSAEMCNLVGQLKNNNQTVMKLAEQVNCPLETLWKIPLTDIVIKHNVMYHPNYKTPASGILDILKQ